MNTGYGVMWMSETMRPIGERATLAQGENDVDALTTAFLHAWSPRWRPATLRKVEYSLAAFRAANNARLPRDPEDVVDFVKDKVGSPNGRRVLYGTLRTFYRWVRENRDPAAPELAHVFFGTRRLGEKRGGARPWQRRSAASIVMSDEVPCGDNG